MIDYTGSPIASGGPALTGEGVRVNGLTELQRRFVEEYVQGNCRNARQAALLAGYSEETANCAHRDILGSTSVRAAVDEAADALRRTFIHRLTVEAGPRAVATVLEVMNDNTASPSARLAAAREVLDRIGVGKADPQTPLQPGTIRVVYAGDADLAASGGDRVQ